MRAERVGESRESPREPRGLKRVDESPRVSKRVDDDSESRRELRVLKRVHEGRRRGRVRGYTEIED